MGLIEEEESQSIVLPECVSTRDKHSNWFRVHNKLSAPQCWTNCLSTSPFLFENSAARTRWIAKYLAFIVYITRPKLVPRSKYLRNMFECSCIVSNSVAKMRFMQIGKCMPGFLTPS